MTDSNNPITQSVVISASNRVYIRLIKWEVASIAIKYEGLPTNPFQEHSIGMLIFLIALFCHVIAPTTAAAAAGPRWLTAILFHGYGLLAFEAGLWVLVGQLPRFFIIDVFMLLVTLMCYHKDIVELVIIFYQKIFGEEEGLIADHVADSQVQEGIDAQVTEIEGNQQPCNGLVEDI